MKIQTTVVEIDEGKETKMLEIEKFIFEWVDITKIQLTVTKRMNADV